MNRRSGLTLLEWLVIVATSLLFIAFLMPSLGTRATSAKSKCLPNLNALGKAVNSFAAQSHGNLPTGDGAACQWLCDLPTAVGDALLDSGVATGHNADSFRKSLYCPANPLQIPENLWDRSAVRTIGYIWLGQRTDAPHLPDLSNNSRPVPPLQYHASTHSASFPDQTVLAADQIISPDPASSNFTAIVRSTGQQTTTSHLNKNKPAGANILYLDGHAEWRNWAGPTQATPLPCEDATFWLPNP